eukprot:scaffold266288_cov39-Tisochrysis_lutea.AAC.2
MDADVTYGTAIADALLEVMLVLHARRGERVGREGGTIYLGGRRSAHMFGSVHFSSGGSLTAPKSVLC